MLQISEKDFRHLAKYSSKCFEEYKKSKDDNLWFGVEYKTTAYDINIYDTNYYGNRNDGMVVCVAYQCEGSKEKGWSANWSEGKVLWEIKK
tara:strand:+ start:308 stop:580 length:273 start_codon:yes stop_codon:yes gene_type:complete